MLLAPRSRFEGQQSLLGGVSIESLILALRACIPLRPSVTDQDVLDNPRFQVVEDPHQKLGAFSCFHPYAQDISGSVRQYTQCQVDRFVTQQAFVGNFDSQLIKKSPHTSAQMVVVARLRPFLKLHR